MVSRLKPLAFASSVQSEALIHRLIPPSGGDAIDGIINFNPAVYHMAERLTDFKNGAHGVLSIDPDVVLFKLQNWCPWQLRLGLHCRGCEATKYLSGMLASCFCSVASAAGMEATAL
mmetsp:Transcript_116619/g.232511  ORF Transcript_116619/g.232511 Transcript_116619/m.232511 type:complete len:117 (-) Transcript_116619:113-463(-)